MDDRTPANDLEAEMHTLGSMMWSEHNILEATRLIDADDYWRPVHAAIHRAILQIQSEGTIPDPYVVQKRLLETGNHKQLPNLTYISDLAAGVPTTVGNTAYYASKVAETADIRRHEALATKLHQANEVDDPDLRNTRYAEVLLELAEINNTGKAKTNHIPEGVDWASVMDDLERPVEWLVEPLIERGQLVSMYSEPKAGKSLIMQEVSAALASGKPVLGNSGRTPVRVLYCDMENTRQDLHDRFLAYGYRPEELGNLTYLLFPPFAPLNTPIGAGQLVAAAEHYQADLIVLDTVARFIEGPENDADTWNALYRLALVPLKAAGRAVMRLDHQGKDPTKGQRGSSAKGGDVDAVWHLVKRNDRSRYLKLEMSRTGRGDVLVELNVSYEPLRHVIPSRGETDRRVAADAAAVQWSKAVQDLSTEMDSLRITHLNGTTDETVLKALLILETRVEVPAGASQRAAYEAMQRYGAYLMEMNRENNLPGKNAVEKAQEIRKKRLLVTPRDVLVTPPTYQDIPGHSLCPGELEVDPGHTRTQPVLELQRGRSEAMPGRPGTPQDIPGHEELAEQDADVLVPPPPRSGVGARTWAARDTEGKPQQREELHACSGCYRPIEAEFEQCDNCRDKEADNAG